MLVITHDSYVSVIKDLGLMKTTPISVVEPSSLVVVENLACLLPAFDQWTNIVCLNTTSYKTKTCSYSIYAGSVAFVSVKNWVYMLDQELDPQSMYRLAVANDCLIYIRTNPVFGEYNFGSHIWYSYDSSRIFLDNGLTLTASSDSQLDMKDHGDFNSSYAQYKYNWFAQLDNYPYLIAGLRSDMNNTLDFYSWPYLQPTAATPIPLPGKATSIYKSEQVHYCQRVLVFCTYKTSSGTLETGIAYMT